MRRRGSELKAGLFVVISFILFWVVLFTVSDIGNIFSPKKTYILAFNQVGGLMKNAPVRYAGFEVGRVIDISFAEPAGKAKPRKRVPEPRVDKPKHFVPVTVCENVFVTIRVRKDIKLTELDEAQVNSSFTGAVILDILPGTPEPDHKPVVINEDYVLLGRRYQTMGELVTRASDVVEGARKVMPAVNEAVNSLTDTMKEAKTTVEKVNAAIEDNRPRLDQTMKDIAEASGSIKGFSADLKALPLHDVFEKVKQAAADAAETLAALKPKAVATADNMEKASVDIKKASSAGLDTINRNRERIDHMLENFRSASARLSIGIEDIRRNPWKLLSRNIKADPKTQNVYDTALAFSDAARALSDAVSDLKVMKESGTATPGEIEKASKELDRLVTNMSLLEKQLYQLYKSPPAP